MLTCGNGRSKGADLLFGSSNRMFVRMGGMSMPRNRSMRTCSSESSASRDMRSAWHPALLQVSAQAGLGLAKRPTERQRHTDAGAVQQRSGLAWQARGRTWWRATTCPASWPSTEATSSRTSSSSSRPVNTTICAAPARCAWHMHIRCSVIGIGSHAGPARLAAHLAAGEHERIHHVAPDDRILPLQALRSAHAASAVLNMTSVACKQLSMPHLEVLLVAAAAPVCSTYALQEGTSAKSNQIAQACGNESSSEWPTNTSNASGKHL